MERVPQTVAGSQRCWEIGSTTGDCLGAQHRRLKRIASCAAHTDNRANWSFARTKPIALDCPCHPIDCPCHPGNPTLNCAVIHRRRVACRREYDYRVTWRLVASSPHPPIVGRGLVPLLAMRPAARFAVFFSDWSLVVSIASLNPFLESWHVELVAGFVVDDCASLLGPSIVRPERRWNGTTTVSTTAGRFWLGSIGFCAGPRLGQRWLEQF